MAVLSVGGCGGVAARVATAGVTASISICAVFAGVVDDARTAASRALISRLALTQVMNFLARPPAQQLIGKIAPYIFVGLLQTTLELVTGALLFHCREHPVPGDCCSSPRCSC